MVVSWQQYLKNISDLISILENNNGDKIGKINAKIGEDAIYLIFKRVHDKGIKADGTEFKKAKNSKSGENYSYGWAKKRKEKSRQVEHLDMSYTGLWWKNIKVISASGHKITIDAVGDLNEKILTGNSERKGKILNLSKEEKEILSQTFIDELLKLLKQMNVA